MEFLQEQKVAEKIYIVLQQLKNIIRYVFLKNICPKSFRISSTYCLVNLFISFQLETEYLPLLPISQNPDYFRRFRLFKMFFSSKFNQLSIKKYIKDF